METKQMNWKNQDNWGWREFILLLLVEFVVVIGIIKWLVKPMYAHLFRNELYAGTLTGFTIAITLVFGVYFIALRPKKLSWREVGITSISLKQWKTILCYSVLLMIGALLIVVLTSYIGFSVENSKTQYHTAERNLLYGTNSLSLCGCYFTNIRRDFLSRVFISLVTYTLRIGRCHYP